MKKLNLFRPFDWEAFSKDKTFICTGAKFSETKQMVVVEMAILSDKTDYGDETISNVFEKFNVSVPGTSKAELNNYASIMNQQCRITGVQKVSVYGDYSNMISVVGYVQPVKG